MFIGHNLSKHINPYLLSDGISAGTGDVQTTTAIDMASMASGGQAVLFIVAFGTIATAGGGLVKVQGSNDSGVADPFVDLGGTGIQYTSAMSGLGVVLDLFRPQKRYLQLVIQRTGGGNTTVQSIVALGYHLLNPPVLPLGLNFGAESWLSNVGPGAA